MDSQTRQILRNGSAEEAYIALARSGLSLDEIEKELIANNKITDKLGEFEDVRVHLKLLSLVRARLLVAEEVFRQYNFGAQMITHPLFGHQREWADIDWLPNGASKPNGAKSSNILKRHISIADADSWTGFRGYNFIVSFNVASATVITAYLVRTDNA